MSRADSDGTDTRRFAADAFPVALAVGRDGGLLAGPEAEASPAAWLLFHHGRCSIRPEASRTPVRLNGERIDAPVWLDAEDELALGPLRLRVAADGNGASVAAAAPNPPGPVPEGDALQPPSDDHARGFGRRIGAAPAPAAGRRRLAGPRNAAIAVLALLALAVAFVLAATPLEVRISPEPDNLAVTGFPPAVPLSGRYLLLPGTYKFRADKAGYRPLRETLKVGAGGRTVAEFAMRKLPGLVTILTPPVAGARILVDGREAGTSPASDLELDPGRREIAIVSERHLRETRTVEVEGESRRQTVEIALRPGWGTLSVDTVPSGATVRMDGREVGSTPVTFEPLAGAHDLEFLLDGWKPAARRFEIVAGQRDTLAPVALERIDGTLRVSSDPPGATVTVNGEYRGLTPTSVALVSERDYAVRIAKAGFGAVARTVRIRGAETTPIDVRLEPEFGTVFLTSSPPGAALRVNGRPAGSATQRLSLQAVPQTLEISKPGYVTAKTTVTPRAGIASRVTIALKTVGEEMRDRDRKGVTTPGGQRIRLVQLLQPARFNVGAPRREPGRRSNEGEYPVELTRSFWISEKEVTNAEFVKFRSGHASGSYHGNALDAPDQPVANVSWEDAARYANWLSKQEGLPPAYREEKGTMVPVLPLGTGYRLPTEAEWEFVARYGARASAPPLRFPWGADMPPPNGSGNYADDGPLRLPFVIPGYADPFPAAAPVGKFPANPAGLYDLGGNVAEWCHDFYDVPAPGGVAQPGRDPAGPADGRFRVIKGASWRTGSVSELRLAYRDYAEKPRNDLGFRIARYADEAPK
jgi:formylglycine-generating enzyme required for sulfatase activity